VAPHVATWLGRSTIDTRLRVVVEDRRASGGAIVFFIVRDGEPVADRSLNPPDASCEDVRAAVGVAIALAIDATYLSSIVGPLPVPPSSSEPAASSPEPSPAARGNSTHDVSLVGARGEVGVVAGALPHVAAAGAMGVEVDVATPWSVRGSAVVLGPGASTLSSGSVRTSLAGGRLDACFGSHVRLCGGALVGAWFASGVDYARELSVTLPWAAGAGRVEGSFDAAKWLRVTIAGDLFLAFLRPRLDVRSESGAIVMSRSADPVGGGLWAGLSFPIP
jgi:hypothetical protein